MNVCITLCYAVGRGVQSVYGDLKEKRSMKQEKKQLRKDRSDSAESYSEPGHDSPSQRRPRLDGQAELSSPVSTSEGNRVLGISSDARAAAHAHRSLALVTGMQQARRNLFDTRRYEVEAIPPPQYDVSAPRLPTYDAVIDVGAHETLV